MDKEDVAGAFWWASDRNSPANAGDTGLIPGQGRSLGGGHSNSPQYSRLKNPMDREAWQATVHGVVKSQTQVKRLSVCMHTHTQTLTHTY